MRNLHLHRVTVEACAACLDAQHPDAAALLRQLLPKEYAPEETTAALVADLVDGLPEPTVRNRQPKVEHVAAEHGDYGLRGADSSNPELK